MIKRIISYLLMIFIIFSIGFYVGKEVALNNHIDRQISFNDIEEKVIVYYLRSTFRCWQCNMIEVYSYDLVISEFSNYLETGRLEWQVVDYLQNREMASRYNISGNTIVVVRYEDGEEADNFRLDKVMEKVFNREEFMNYVREGILSQLYYVK